MPQKKPSVRWWLTRRIVVNRPKGYVVAWVLTVDDLARLGLNDPEAAPNPHPRTRGRKP